MENSEWEQSREENSQEENPHVLALQRVLKKSRKRHILNIFLWILVVILIGGNVFLYSLVGNGGSKLDELEALITERYIGDSDPVNLEDAAAAGMIQAMGDRWSYYIPAEEYQSHQELMANAYVGVGITILLEKDQAGFFIQQVTPGGPAQEAGILPGDILIAIEDQTTEEMLTTDARDLIRGPEGTTVDVIILRDGEQIPFTLERRTIKTQVASGRMVTEDIGVVRINNFDDRCAEESIAAIEELKKQGAKKLIFDVRFNPGGYAHELVRLLDYLLPEGDLFRTVDFAGHENVDRSDASFLDMPMAVIVNGDSYSAAEFFAAALRDYEAGLIIGEKTCGKGRFQQTYLLSDGSAANISVGNYFTPKGVSLDGVGLTPDVELAVDEETAMEIVSQTIEDEKDPQLQAAIQALNEEITE